MLQRFSAVRGFAGAGVSALLVLAMCSSGCSSGAASRRPVLESSVAEAATTSPSPELEFFDGLESRKLVCHDDVLHAVLLLANGRSESTPADRRMLAMKLGYIAEGFDRAGREAATVGEVAVLVERLIESEGSTLPARMPQDTAIARLSGRGVLPNQVKAFQGLTGAQLLTVLSGVRPLLEDRPRAMLSLGDLSARESASVSSTVRGETLSAQVAGPETDITEPASGEAAEPATIQPDPAPEYVPGQPVRRPGN